MSRQIKIGILIFLAFVGVLINYEVTEKGNFLFFPKIENPYFTFVPLFSKSNNQFSATTTTNGITNKNYWGWPFAYWQNNNFDFKALVFDIIFYFVIWLILLSIIWFVVGVKKIEERRLKPPKFKF